MDTNTVKVLNMLRAQQIAEHIAHTECVDMVWGWQHNDDTGEDEPGYCPAFVVGPCFVHTVVGTAPAREVQS